MKIEQVDIDFIIPNSEQPRKSFDEESLLDLKRSIERNGILQPILIKKFDGGYKIIAGERRWRAAMSLGMRSVPAIVIEVSDEKEMEISIIENIQREDLNSIEEAMAFKRFLESTGETQESLGNIMGKSRSYISNSMRLLSLPEPIIDDLKNNRMTSGHGRAILAVEDEKVQLELGNRVKAESLTVRELEEIASKIKGSNKEKAPRSKDIFINEIEERLTKNLGKKVKITRGRSKNKLEIEYKNEDELEYLINILENHSDIYIKGKEN